MLSVDDLRLYFVLATALFGLIVMLLVANGDNKGRSTRLVWAYIFIMFVLVGGLYYINLNPLKVLGWFN